MKSNEFFSKSKAENEADVLKNDSHVISNNVYLELLDFCPIGILKINLKAEIIEMNQYAANLLDESQLNRNANFTAFLSNESIPGFEETLMQAQFDKEKYSISADVITKNNITIHVLLSVLFSKIENLFLLSLIDISEQNIMEMNLNKKCEKLEWINQMLISRELRMIELKKEVNKLLEQHGEPGKYDF